jgi:hypothetical protein
LGDRAINRSIVRLSDNASPRTSRKWSYLPGSTELPEKNGPRNERQLHHRANILQGYFITATAISAAAILAIAVVVVFALGGHFESAAPPAPAALHIN